MEMRCCPMRRTISWSVWVMRRPGGGRSPLRDASPLTCGAPLAQGWCMSAGRAGRAGGDSLRDRLRGGRCPAPSSPESVEARLARSAAPASRARRSAEITSVPAASASTASTPRPSDVTAARYAPPALNRPSPFVRHCKTVASPLLLLEALFLNVFSTWIELMK